MTQRLSQAQRNAIIYDFINGIANEDYEVKKTKTGKYQVRKRKSPFIAPPGRGSVPLQGHDPDPEPEPIQEPEQEHDPVEEEDALNRISNEQLLMKLSSLLELKSQESDSDDEYLNTAPTEVPTQTVQTAPTVQPQQTQTLRRGSRKRLSLI